MPKILVLFTGQPSATVNAVADGARSVRFSEVEMRRVARAERDGDVPPDVHQALAGAEEMMPYDAIVVAASAGGSLDPALAQVLEQATASAPASTWQNKVGSAFLAEESSGSVDVWPALARLGTMGMLVVAPSAAGADAAGELGMRVAKVVGWVTHARSHHHDHHTH